tara:strand:- start:1997 stop:2815 length:819 start_codon:yes stop_codon:yes gene_type:complete
MRRIQEFFTIEETYPFRACGASTKSVFNVRAAKAIRGDDRYTLSAVRSKNYDGSFTVDKYENIKDKLKLMNKKMRELGYAQPIKELRFKVWAEKESQIISDGEHYNKKLFKKPISMMVDGKTSNLKEAIDKGEVSRNLFVFLSRANWGRWQRKSTKRTEAWPHGDSIVCTLWTKCATLHYKKTNSNDNVKTYDIKKGDITIAEHEEMWIGDIVGSFAEAFHIIYKDAVLTPLDKGSYKNPIMTTAAEAEARWNRMDGTEWVQENTLNTDLEG